MSNVNESSFEIQIVFIYESETDQSTIQVKRMVDG